MWDERYAVTEYVYGTAPNTFLVSQTGDLQPGRVLCLGEGEGRNAVYLAGKGHTVLAVDSSAVGLGKARRLAAERKVEIATLTVDLAEFAIEPCRYDLVVSIFCHLPPTLRSRVHGLVVAGLRPGGRFLLEAYTPDQLAHGTGGPKLPELLVTLEDLQPELAGLDLLLARETERQVIEGSLHNGMGAVVQVVAQKPAGPTAY